MLRELPRKAFEGETKMYPFGMVPLSYEPPWFKQNQDIAPTIEFHLSKVHRPFHEFGKPRQTAADARFHRRKHGTTSERGGRLSPQLAVTRQRANEKHKIISCKQHLATPQLACCHVAELCVKPRTLLGPVPSLDGPCTCRSVLSKCRAGP